MSIQLLTYLDAVFPDRLSLADHLGLEGARGARAVIEHLHQLYQSQQEE